MISSFDLWIVFVTAGSGFSCMDRRKDELVYCLSVVELLGVRSVVVLGFGFASCMPVPVAFAPQITIVPASCAAYSRLVVGEEKSTQGLEGALILDKYITGSKLQNQPALALRHSMRIERGSRGMH